MDLKTNSKFRQIVNKKVLCTKYKNNEQQYEFDIRLTCDNRAVNKAIKRTRYPSKTVDDLIYLVNGATIFSTLDLIKAFHQAMLAEQSRNLTTITTHIGLLRYKRLHMGIACASEIFTEHLRVILEKCPGQINMTDDILVFGKTPEEHENNLMLILKTLEENGITLNREKCNFYKDEVTFFGLKFSKDGVSPTEDRFKTIREAPIPNNAKELHSFLCSMVWSSRFVKNASMVAEPLW